MGIFLAPSPLGVSTVVAGQRLRFSKTIDGEREKVNFIVYYEIDDEEVKTVLRAAEHGGEEDGAWVLLEPAEPGAEPVAAAAVE